jgi:hypothetical protein
LRVQFFGPKLISDAPVRRAFGGPSEYIISEISEHLWRVKNKHVHRDTRHLLNIRGIVEVDMHACKAAEGGVGVE